MNQNKISETYYYFALICLVAVPNIVLSFSYVALVHDDGYQLWASSTYSNKSWLGFTHFLNSFREDILFHIAAFGSPQIARLCVVVFYLCGSACLFFRFLRFFFNCKSEFAFFVSAMPFMVLSLWQIPLGINISYVAGDVLFSLLAMSLICGFLKRDGFYTIDLILLFIVFVLMAETQQSATVTTPIIVTLALSWGPTSILKKAIAAFTTLFAMFYVATSESEVSRLSILHLSDALKTLRSFWMNSLDVMEPAFHIPYWNLLSLALFCIGLTVLAVQAFESVNEYRKNLRAFATQIVIGNKRLCAFLTVIVGLFWAFIPYSLVTKHLNPVIGTRYYYIWQFFFWVTFTVGMYGLFSLLQKGLSNISFLKRHEKKANRIIVSIFSSAVVISVACFSWGKGSNFNEHMVEKNGFIKPFRRSIRNFLGSDYRPRDQVLVLISNIQKARMIHVSNHQVNTGYLNYLINPIAFNFVKFGNPTRCSSHFSPVLKRFWGVYNVGGYSLERPLAVYYYDSSTKEMAVMSYLVDMYASPNKDRFALYDVRGVLPSLIEDFKSSEELSFYIEQSSIPLQKVAYGAALKYGCKGKR